MSDRIIAVLSIVIVMAASFAIVPAMASDDSYADTAVTETIEKSVKVSDDAYLNVGIVTVIRITGLSSAASPTCSFVSGTLPDGVTYKDASSSRRNSGGYYSYSSFRLDGTFVTEGVYRFSVLATNVSTSVTADVTITVMGDRKECTVSFDANGGSSQTSSVVTLEGENITLPTATKPYCTFAGWYTASSGGTFVGTAGGTYAPSSDVTLYAHYDPIPVTITSSQGDAYCIMGSSFVYDVSTTPADATLSVSGATWLSVSGHSVSGTPTASNAMPGTYHVTVTAIYGTQSVVQTFDVTVVEKLSFESAPTGGIVATPV